MGATLANQFPLYKEHYLGNLPEIFFTSQKLTSPVLAAMESKSMDDGGGRGFVVPVIHRLPGAVGSSFASAQTKARGTGTGSTFGSERWVVDAVKTSGIAVFTENSVLAAKGDSEKMLDVIKIGMETTTAAIRKRLAHYASGAGWGKIGTVLSVTSTTIGIDPELCNLVQEGDDVAGAATESASAFRAITGGDETTVTAIDRTTGVLTVDQDPTAGAAIAVGDILFRFEDREDSATPTRLVLSGLDAWFGTDTVLHGVTRTGKADLTALQVNGAGKTAAQATVEAIKRLFQYDSHASAMYVSPVDYGVISLDKDSVKVVSMEVGKYKLGFEGLAASWSGYSVPILPDAMIEPGKAYLGPFDNADWCPFFAHNGDLVNISNEDGQEVRAIDGSDAYESRLYNRGNIICPAPGKFARITGFNT